MKNFGNSEFVTLQDYIPVPAFRIIPEEVREYTHPAHQTAVEVIKFIKQVTIDSPVMGKLHHDEYKTLYGFVFDNAKILEIFKALGSEDPEERKIILRDNKDEYLLQFQTGSMEHTLFVSIAEVNELLDKCLKPMNFES